MSYLESLFCCIEWEKSRLNHRSGEKGSELPPNSGWRQFPALLPSLVVEPRAHINQFLFSFESEWDSKLDQSWEYINHSQIYKCRNWEQGCTVSFLEIFVSHFRYSAINIQSSKKEFPRKKITESLKRQVCAADGA